MSDIVTKSYKAVGELEKLKDEMIECNSDRTLFQLEKFVVGQHDTPGRRYLQVMTELAACYFEIKRMMIDLSEAKHLAIEEKTSCFDQMRQRLRIEQVELQLDSKHKEFVKLMAIKQTMKPYTAMDIEKEDAEYYQKRLERQSNEFMLSNKTGIPVGELRSQEQAGMIKIVCDTLAGQSRVTIRKLENK